MNETKSSGRYDILNDENHSLGNEIKAPRIWGAVAVAFILLLSASVWELLLNLNESQLMPAARIAHLSDPWFFKQHVFAAFTRELGFALFIAILVGLIIERVSRVQHLNSAKAILKLVADDVFDAVLEKKIPCLSG